MIRPSNLKAVLITLLAGLWLAALALPASAQSSPENLGEFRDWTAFKVVNGGEKICWIATKPLESLPAGVRRGDVYLMLTHRPGQNVKNEVSVITGYTYEPNSVVKATIGTSELKLFTDGDGAWLRTPEEETAAVKAMRKGSKITVIGTSNRGTKTTDSFSLLGFTAALKTIGEACNIR